MTRLKLLKMSDWFLAQLPILYGTVALICKGETNFESLWGLTSETVLCVFVWGKPGLEEAAVVEGGCTGFML